MNLFYSQDLVFGDGLQFAAFFLDSGSQLGIVGRVHDLGLHADLTGFFFLVDLLFQSPDDHHHEDEGDQIKTECVHGHFESLVFGFVAFNNNIKAEKEGIVMVQIEPNGLQPIETPLFLAQAKANILFLATPDNKAPTELRSKLDALIPASPLFPLKTDMRNIDINCARVRDRERLHLWG